MVQTQSQFDIKTDLGVIRGECHEPSADAMIHATVQIVHGYFSSHRIGPNRLYVKLARFLCEAGFVVIRADALGVGESDGDFEQASFGSELRDAFTVHKFICSRYPNFQRVVIGHSMGANVALRMASESEDVSLVVPISPILMNHGGITKIFSTEQRNELTLSGQTVRSGLLVRQGLLSEWQVNDAATLAKGVRIPVTVFQGKADQFYIPSGAAELIEGKVDGKCFMIENADHNFLNTDARTELFLNVKRELLDQFYKGKP